MSDLDLMRATFMPFPDLWAADTPHDALGDFILRVYPGEDMIRDLSGRHGLDADRIVAMIEAWCEENGFPLTERLRGVIVGRTRDVLRASVAVKHSPYGGIDYPTVVQALVDWDQEGDWPPKQDTLAEDGLNGIGSRRIRQILKEAKRTWKDAVDEARHRRP